MRKWGRVLFGCVCALAWSADLVVPIKAQSPSPDLFTACWLSAKFDSNTSGSTLLDTASSTQRIYVCGWNIFADGTVNVKLVYGTQVTNPCDTGTTSVTPTWQFTAQTQNVDHLPVYTGVTPVPSSNQLCINLSAGVQVQAIIYYAKF